MLVLFCLNNATIVVCLFIIIMSRRYRPHGYRPHGYWLRTKRPVEASDSQYKLSAKLLAKRGPLERLAREILGSVNQEMIQEIGMTKDCFSLLQDYSKWFLKKPLNAFKLAAIHGKSLTITLKDMQLVHDILGVFGTDFSKQFFTDWHLKNQQRDQRDQTAGREEVAVSAEQPVESHGRDEAEQAIKRERDPDLIEDCSKKIKREPFDGRTEEAEPDYYDFDELVGINQRRMKKEESEVTTLSSDESD